MAKRLSVLVALGVLLAGTAAAQDAQRVVRAAADAMGDPSNVRYSGTGWVANVGQSYTPDDDWPRFDVPAYTRTIDYDNRSSREEYTRRQGNYPPRGGGAPLQGEQRRVFLTSGENSWNMNGPNPAPQPAAAEVRQLDIWLSPHGFLKAAADANDATAVSLMLQGRDLTIVSFTAMDNYRVNGTINEDNLVEAGPNLGCEPHLWRHDLRPPLHGISRLRWRDVSDRAALPPGRSQDPPRAQLDGDPSDERSGQRERDGSPRAGQRAARPLYRQSRLSPRSWPTVCGASRAAPITA